MIGIGPGIGVSRPRGLDRAIRAMFSQGEVGVWYDPSDFSTMFQDNLGATAVTAVGQTVGLMLDKSKGLVLGPELVTNGGFDTDSTWVKGTGWSISSGVATHSGTTAGYIGYTFLTAGKWYEIEVTINASDGRSLVLVSGAWSSTVTIGSSAGTYRLKALCAASSNSLFYANNAGTTLSIDNISVKELPGYHATQATSTARPILGRHPITGRRNLLTYTEDFSNAAWVLLGTTTKTPNYGIAPDGTQTATRIVIGTTTGDGFQQLYSTTAGANASYTAGIWIKSTSGSSQAVRIKNTHAGVLDNFLNVTATATWQFVSLSVTNGATAGTGQYIGVQNDLTALAKDILVWHPDLEFGLSPTAYQKVVSTYDVTEAGVNDAYYLKFDGVDDFMVTPSIDFSGTDKMSVFAGVRKLSDAAVGIIVESSVSIATNNGAFALYCPAGAGTNDYAATSKGTIQINKDTAANYPSPNTAVCAATFDIIGDSVWLRVNSSETVSSIADQGLGNYGNYPLYIGMRAGTVLPFNGHLYSLVVRGALSDANQISAAEAYVNSRTGSY